MKNYTKETLYQLSIYQVRAIAREVGVQSPASLRKEELIDKIIAISTGKMERFVPKNNKGRPAKPVDGLNDFIQTFLPESTERTDFFDPQINVDAPNKEEENIFNASVSGKTVFDGYIDFYNGNIGLIKKGFMQTKDEAAFISSILIDKNNIRIGDYVSAHVQVLSNGKLVAQNIQSVNGKVDVGQRPLFEHATPIFPKEAIDFKNNKIINYFSPIGFGQRTLIEGDNVYLLKKVLLDLYNQANGEKLLVICDTQPEERLKYENDPNIICLDGEDDECKLSVLRLAIASLHRKAENRAKTTFFIFGGETLFNLIKSNKQLVAFSASDWVNLFKNTKEFGSCGVVLAHLNRERNEINTFVSKVFNERIVLNSELALFDVDCPVDLNRVDLFRDYNLMLPARFEQLKEFRKRHLGFKDMAEVLNNL